MFEEKYIVKSKIYETKSSTIYKAINKYNEKILYVIKVEKNSKDDLKNEIKITKAIEGGPGIPKIIQYGIYQNKIYLIYPFINTTLNNINLKKMQIYNFACQLITTLEYIHKKGIVHCDITPRNILFDNYDKFILNDFGLAKHYSFSISEKSNNLVGSPYYCSLNVHDKLDYMPRDDLISLGYVLVYLVKNSLPWYGSKICKEIKREKENFNINFFNFELPDEIKIYLNYCFHLDINEKPSYNILLELFKEDRPKTISIST